MSTTNSSSENTSDSTSIAAMGGESFIPSDETPVFLTPSALEAIKKALADEGEEGDFLRISVVGGGCSGYQYGLDFDKEDRMGDLVLASGEVKVVIDPISAGFIRGTVVDYISGLHGTGFQFKNPNSKRTCGCGSSFS